MVKLTIDILIVCIIIYCLAVESNSFFVLWLELTQHLYKHVFPDVVTSPVVQIDSGFNKHLVCDEIFVFVESNTTVL